MTLTPHSIIHGDAYFAYFNKIWGIPLLCAFRGLVMQQLAAILLLDGPTPRKMKLPATHRRIP